MVVFDNSIFCLALHPDAQPSGGTDRAQDRIEHLLETLKANQETIIIPAPVLSEFLVFAGADAPAYLAKIRESSVLRVEPFDERAAIELADLEIAARQQGNKRGSAAASDWQKVKFDRQIVAIARVHRASVVYSNDADIAAHGRDCGLTVLGLADLPLPPSKQLNLLDSLGNGAGDRDERTQPGSPQVPGSEGEPSAGEARDQDKGAGEG